MYEQAIGLSHNLLESPEAWTDHCRQASAATIMGMAYGKVPGSMPEEKKATAENLKAFALGLTEIGRPGSYMVDIFPWLRFIPKRYAPPSKNENFRSEWLNRARTRFSPWKITAEEKFAKDSALLKSWLDTTRNLLVRPCALSHIILDSR